MKSPQLSILIPAYNEQDNIAKMCQTLFTVLNPLKIEFEILFIDDGSTDNTLVEIKELANTHTNIRFASLSRNFGHESASSCAFQMARGESAVLLDADLQDPPEIIPVMIDKWKQGYDIVYGKRKSRKHEGFFKKLSAFLFYRLLRGLSQVDIPPDVGDFRLVDRRVIDNFNQLPERSRFVRGMFAWVGFRQTAVEFDRSARHAGKSKYSLLKLSLLSFDALVGFSLVPLRLCIAFGLFITLISFLLATIIIIQRLFLDLNIPGYTLTTAGMFFLGGVQLTFLGVIGEYVGKIYTQVQGRPLYIIRETNVDLMTMGTAPDT